MSIFNTQRDVIFKSDHSEWNDVLNKQLNSISYRKLKQKQKIVYMQFTFKQTIINA